uniref:TPX2 domain-containing protein n=1 Tax=Caenorhabditis tropicalis TaxID=1561998 RepID=A0A1I7V2W9_9PELO
MSTKRDPQVKRNLQATADLLEALRENPELLNDVEFMKRLSILREKHEETTNFLAGKIGAAPLPTMISSSKTTETKTSSKVHISTSCHQIQDEFPRHLDLKPRTETREHEYHVLQTEDFQGRTYGSQRSYPDYEIARVHISPPKIRVPIRIAPAPPIDPQRINPQDVVRPTAVINQVAPMRSEIPRRLENRISRSSSLSRHRQSSASRRAPNSASHVRQVLANATAKHQIPASVAMPSGLLTSALTKHIQRNPPQFATTSDVVEESFLEDGMSTTREVPTIVDEIVVDPKTSKKVTINGSLSHKQRSKSMHNMAEPQVTIPKPFQLSLRTSTGNTYAKKFMTDLMSEKQRREEDAKKQLETAKFKAKPVPKSTYLPTNTFATEQKYIAAMRKKIAAMARKKFEAQNEMVRSKSEGNLDSIKPLGYVPPSTYISPIPVKPNARSRTAVHRSAIMIQEATTPKGIKSHRNQSNLTHNLRHGRCKIDTSAVALHRRTSPPDFNKIHAKFNEEYRRFNSKPSTVPMPFNFAKRSKSATSRHVHCKEKESEQFRPLARTQDLSKSSLNIVPSNQATRLRQELIRNKLQKEKADQAEKNSLWAEDNRKRIASFLGARSKTDENIAMLTRRRLEQQRETEQDYLRQLTEMKQRVLNGPLIMEKQTALAQEHRLKRKFELRMKTAKAAGQAPLKTKPESRRGSETSAAGTFVVEKDGYEEDFESKIESTTKTSSESGSSKSSKSSNSSKSSGSSGSSKSSSQSSSEEESSEEDESPR